MSATDDALTAPGHVRVRVLHTPDPRAEAHQLAEDLGGDVAADAGTAEELVRARVEAGRRAVGGDDDDAVLARADAIRAAAASEPPLRDDEVEELRDMAADLGRAARIRDRTEAKVTEVLQAKVAASTGVALHPSAVLNAAEAVLAAEAALAIAERQVLEHGSPPAAPGRVAGTRDDPVLSRPHDDFDEAHLERRRGLRTGVLVVIFLLVAGGVAVAVGAPIFILPALAVVAILLAGLAAWRGHHVAARVGEADANLAAVGRAVADTDSGRKLASMDATVVQDAHEAWVTRRARLDASRDEAEELLRVARNRWHQLAGADADAHRADDVVRAYDPQLVYDSRVAQTSPTVRTVAAFHRKILARWRVAWAGVGRDQPPEPEAIEEVLEEMLGDHRRALEELRRLEVAEARAAAVVAVRRPLLLVEPGEWVESGRLAQLLSSVPPEGEVVLVERDLDAAR